MGATEMSISLPANAQHGGLDGPEYLSRDDDYRYSSSGKKITWLNWFVAGMIIVVAWNISADNLKYIKILKKRSPGVFRRGFASFTYSSMLV